MTRHLPIIPVLLSGAIAIYAQEASALPLPNTAQSVISDNAMSNVLGSTMTNQAAGNNNLQANVANIIMSPNGQGAGTINGKVVQQSVQSNSDVYSAQQTHISGNAFANSVGILGINQAAGSGNAESNQTSIVMGALKPVSNQALSQTLTGPSKQAGTQAASVGGGIQKVEVAASAFRGAGGIAQVNQVSGSGNASANSFALGVAPGVMQ
ncbi:hypothetical protein [Acidithiobacillus sp. AMEEHan]|uniref:hypothetical protein n=1 Tax=Acidithiobacillus sp. AMEEHan TaxID=2994951 RepID=UPI0027E51F77|nr:hypothetical protein [Acidithiobacillus sp. AMEEHan]